VRTFKLGPTGSAKLLTLGTLDGAKCQYCDEVKRLSQELANISDGRIVMQYFFIEDANGLAARLRVKRVPVMVVTSEKREYCNEVLRPPIWK
jgi:hypothetical protein